MVENKVIVELKAVSELKDGHTSLVINYLKAFGLEVGLLLNFGRKRLEIKRYVNRIVINLEVTMGCLDGWNEGSAN